MGNEQGVSNPKGPRAVSDVLDDMGLRNHIRVRGLIHGTWHDGAGYVKSLRGNEIGAKAEHD